MSQNHPGWAADGCLGRNGAAESRDEPGRQLGGLEITPVRIMGLSATVGTGNEVGEKQAEICTETIPMLSFVLVGLGGGVAVVVVRKNPNVHE